MEKLSFTREFEQQAVLVQTIENLEPNIRFCRYELKKSGIEDDSEEELKKHLNELEVRTFKFNSFGINLN